MGKFFKENKKLSIAFLIVLIFIIIPCGIYGYRFRSYSFSNQTADWGVFGDYMGGILNPILGFVSFIGVLCTIKLQSDELAATREELARSAEAQELQTEIFQRQQFETNFFILFEQATKLSSIIEQDESYKKFVNKLCADYKFQLEKYVRSELESLQFMMNRELPKNFKFYCSLVCNILEIIDNSSLVEKQHYTNLLQISMPFNLLQLFAITICCLEIICYNYMLP